MFIAYLIDYCNNIGSNKHHHHRTRQGSVSLYI